MQNENIVPFEDLQEMAGQKTVKGVVQFCASKGIRFITGRGCVTTTIKALDEAMGLSEESSNDEVKIL